MALSRDGQSLVLATPTDRNAILIVRTSNGEVVKAIEVSSPVSCLEREAPSVQSSLALRTERLGYFAWV